VGYKARSQAYSPEQDNSGVNDLGFVCVNDARTNAATLRFGDDKVLKAEPNLEKRVARDEVVYAKMGVGEGGVGTQGGWSNAFNCQTGSYACGLQTRMQTPKDTGSDAMGVTNVRLYCCTDSDSTEEGGTEGS